VKFAVVGTGAIGGYLGGWLAASGQDVTFIARGPNLDALAKHGIRVIGEDGTEIVAKGRAVAHPGDAGPQDVVLLAVKAHQVAAIAPDLAKLTHDQTTVVTLQNGIPWWYFHKHGGPYEGRRLESVDPGGTAAQHIDANRVLGAVVYPAAVLEQPGVVRVVEGKRFSLGEPDGSESPRALAVSEALTRAGFKAPVVKDIRAEIWVKLLGNLSMNPISALTHTTLSELLAFPLTRDLCIRMMQEAEAVAGKLGITFRIGIEKRIAGAEKVGAHKTSMLQDVEAGKPIELEALVGSVVELGRLTETPTPHIDAVYACASLLAKTLAEHRATLSIHRS
jgi:2-dehydropantoate 2-reductase